MRCKVIAIVIAILGSWPVAAQSDSTFTGTYYFGSLNSGVLFGKKGNGNSFSVSTIHGVRYKRFALGAGLGYDAYPDWNVLPLFASVGYDVVQGRRNALYLQLNSGYSKAWATAANNSQSLYAVDGGYFYHPIVGYRITRDHLTVYFSAGYKFQRLTYEERPGWWTWGTAGSKVTVQRNIERLSLHLGLGI